ncbi:MAG: succinylglutamate desuccinylase [Prevotella sp.]|jgi:predicted deacylase
MRKQLIFDMSSPYRDNFRIYSYSFGSEEKTVAVVGPMRGDEVQQQFVCSQLIKQLTELEADGEIKEMGIMVIPSCNPFSMNVRHRFWSMDSTDINRMFPGYDKGETTQRIADVVFRQIKDFEYGIQMASFYISGDFVPHVRMLKTGYEDVKTAQLFGFPYITVRTPLPFDTTLLNYNWQVWNTKAFSVYAGETDRVNMSNCKQTVDAILRFLHRIGVLHHRVSRNAYESQLLDEEELINVRAGQAGIINRLKKPGDEVAKGELLAEIIDPYEGNILQRLISPVHGMVFFSVNHPLTLQHSIIYRIIKE